MSDPIFDRHFANELDAARIQLEGERNKVLIVGVSTTDEGEHTAVTLGGSVSDGLTQHHVRSFIGALKRSIAKMEKALAEKGLTP